MPSTQSIRAGRAFVELFADDSKLVRGLRKAERKIKTFGQGIRSYGLKLAGLGTAIIGPLAASAKLFSTYGDQVAKMAKRTGLSVETLSELRFVASQTGTEFESLEMAFRKMQRSIYDAGRGLSTQADALKDLGVAFSHLEGLSPEDQFKLLADHISDIEDPTRKAAIAMTLFGRTGTNLLPMFAAGSQGIEGLQKQARDLGLTMSSEDAKAAEDFTDALDQLWKTLRMGVFHIGAALAPLLQKLTETITRIVVTVSNWIKTNKMVIVQAFKIAAIVTAVGIGLIALGGLITATGIALGAIASVIAGISTAFGVLASVIGFLVTPIGLVAIALGSLAAYFVYASGIAGKAVHWLSERLMNLKTFAFKAFEGIADALAAGDIALAAEVLWLSLKVQWIKGVNTIQSIWLGLKHFIADVLVGAFTGALAALQVVWHGLEVAWIETTSFLATAWHGFVNIFLRSWEKMKALAAKTWNYIKSFFSDSIDVTVANKQIDEALTRRLDEIDQDTGEAVIGNDLRRQSRRKQTAELNDLTLGVIGQRYEDEQTRQQQERAKAELEAERSLIEAKQAWEDAIAEARRKRDQVQLENGDKLELPQLPDIGDLVAREAERIGVRGTFNGGSIQALQVAGLGQENDAADRAARAGEETARNTRKLLDIVRDQPGLTFG
ncbi:hypothetical protein KS4_10960 [Poriferisphaera corsica]|uniref:Phage tail tape measure protein n=1 Tax=Poriferisphaera corsica TaxID=2528020 RepID=A0A517YS55_9BACT|nr:phage tail tape measure protein [Poriferisphaera corsica]QDU33055.1 hypothetical protein KS4_10960 [Poriferisphaera corsica]